jgi:hypothetical protein
MTVSAGWYDDPDSAEHWRWWDGSSWGPRAPKVSAAEDGAAPPLAGAIPVSPQARPSDKRFLKITAVFAALGLLWVLGANGANNSPLPATSTQAPPSTVTPQPPRPPTTTTPPPTPEPEVVTISAEGDGNTPPFNLGGGDYLVTATFGADCYYGLELTGLDGQRRHNVGTSLDPGKQETYIYGVQPGRYYIMTYTGPPPRCPWSLTFERVG